MRLNQRHSTRYSKRSDLYLPRISSHARTLLMLLLPLLLVAVLLQDRIHSAVASGGNPLAPFVAPPTNLQVVGLDTSLQVNWTPSTDPTTAWHLVSVWDGTQMQQSKVVGRTSRAAQANGVVPGRTYTVKVQAMDAAGNLSAPATVVAASDPQSPMRNAAFFDNFNEGVGDLNSDFYDVRSSEGNGQRPADVGQEGKFLVFKSEHHFHTEMIGGLERGELYIRPRVPMDLSDNGVRTFQTEFDISATQHSEGKWPEIHFVAADMVPWSAEEFGAGDGDDLNNSLEFSVRADNGSNTSNFPQISVNINGVATTYMGTAPIFTPVNVRLPVVVRMSRTFAELYINGVMVVHADGFNLPFAQGYWMLAHRSWYSGRDRVTSPVVNQVVHWDMLQFDGPAGSINPTARTYIQPGCPAVVRNDSGVISGCPVININHYTPSYTQNFNVADSISAARSAVLRFNGWSTNGQLTMTLNGHTMTLNTATGGYQNVLNSYDVPAGWLQQGANSLVLSSSGTNDAAISEVQLETVFNIPRQMNTQLMTSPMPMLQVTNNNFRIDHLVNDPAIYTTTTYMYNIGGTQTVPYTVEVLNPRPFMTLSTTSGTLVSPSYGGGVTPLNMRFDFTGVSTDDDGDVIVVRVNGGVMPVYIGVMVVASGATTAPPFLTTFPLTTDFNKAAIPDYHGGGNTSPTPVPPTNTAVPTLAPTGTGTPTAPPQATGTPTFTRTATRTATQAPATNTPAATFTGVATSTRTPAATNTQAPTNTQVPTNTLAPTNTQTATPSSTPSPVNTPTGVNCAPVDWTNLLNVTVSANNIQKTAGSTSNWDAGANSLRTIQSGDGYVLTTVDDTTTTKMFGLNSGNRATRQPNLKFAFSLASGTLKIYENGQLKGSFGAYNVGDTLKVGVEAGVVRYYRNGALVYTSAGNPHFPLYYDSTIYTKLARVTGANICVPGLAPNPAGSK